MAEGEGVVAGVLFEERGEVGVGSGGGAEKMKKVAMIAARDPSARRTTGCAGRGGRGIGDGEGLGFGGFVVEPAGDEKVSRGSEGRT